LIDDPELPPVGVIPLDGATARFRVWAPKALAVELVQGKGEKVQRVPMEAEPRGYFGATVAMPAHGLRYAYSLDGAPPRPDPCSRWQPEGTQAPSAVYFPERFAWDEGAWKGRERADLVYYELHVGTFTPEGSFTAIIPRLPELLDLGITVLELMPVGEFPGRWSWGYDGVFPFAPAHSYGGPEELQRLVAACHRAGMAVVLDVVYNHFGPEGNVFPDFGPYLTDKYKSDWGSALNFDGRGSDAVRAMVLDNARMWIRDYHFDGLRLDAADQIFDRSPTPILAEVAEVVHAEAALRGRSAHVFAENDMNDAVRFLREPGRGGFGLDGQWNDDFHHAAHVVLTGETNGYYVDFADGPSALAKVYGRVFVNDGNVSPFRGRRHGAPAIEFSGDRFLAFTQNHDQVGNRLKSDRNAASLPPSAVRLAAGLLLLSPRIPLLFMGEEYGETHPFPFFCDFETPDLIKAVRDGRTAEFAHFGWEEEPADPLAQSTRDAAVLNWSWADPLRAGLRRLYRDLLRLRREAAALKDFRHPGVRVVGDAVLDVTRGREDGDCLRVVFNLNGRPQPIPVGLAEEVPAFRSEIARYGAAAGGEGLNGLRPHEFAIFGRLPLG